jgi:hypothetical protein
VENKELTEVGLLCPRVGGVGRDKDLSSFVEVTVATVVFMALEEGQEMVSSPPCYGHHTREEGKRVGWGWVNDNVRVGGHVLHHGPMI